MKPALIKPIDDARNVTDARATLSQALSRVTLDVRMPGTDIQLGTTFYTPVVTLLARGLGTRRQDVVYCAYPLLGCSYTYYESALPVLYTNDKLTQNRVSFKEMLDTRMIAQGNRPAVLHEIIDLLQSGVGWKLAQLVPWVRNIEEGIARGHEGLLQCLQTMADTARKMHDDAGMREPEVGLTEGLVIPAGGTGRIN